jgi:hypothetical protein
LLRFRLDQVCVSSLGRYFLPLPKMGARQLDIIGSHLAERGFRVHHEGGKLTALKGRSRITVNGRLGLAASSADMLDAIGPAIPRVIGSRGDDMDETRDVSSFYFSTKRKSSGRAGAVHFFPRIESSSNWMSLRKEGLAGLTPDESAALSCAAVAGGVTKDLVPCVTESPRDGSVPLQLGRRMFYKSSLPTDDFLDSLRVLGSSPRPPVTYLPKDSILSFASLGPEPRVPRRVLGEWFCA